MNQGDSEQPKRSSVRPSRRELRSSLLLPVGIVLAIWIVGLVVYALAPGEFNIVVALVIGAGLLIFLLIWTRRIQPRLRLIAVLAALPALAGMTAGVISGRSRYAVIGIAFTFLLLVLQRLLSTPGSYRAAYRRFQAGDTGRALQLVNKAIAARPEYWQSYQLRALVYLLHGDLAAAEQDAGHAIERQPEAHQNYNTLGQIYLAERRFADARDVYQEAIRLAPDHAMYYYYLGFSHYRLQAYTAAAGALTAAIGGTLPVVEYDLLAHYYLGCSLEALGETAAAAGVYAAMANFAGGLERLHEQLDDQQGHAHLDLLRADLAGLEERLRVGGWAGRRVGE